MSYERFLAPLIREKEEREKNEPARRLARYDEAIRLLTEAANVLTDCSIDRTWREDLFMRTIDRLGTFLAAEGRK